MDPCLTVYNLLLLHSMLERGNDAISRLENVSKSLSTHSESDSTVENKWMVGGWEGDVGNRGWGLKSTSIIMEKRKGSHTTHVLQV